MKKLLNICSILILLTGCGMHPKENNVSNVDSRGLYFIVESMGRYIYSDEENPMFIEYDVKTSIKDFLPQSNCIYSCIHNDSEPVETLWDGGTNVYEYMVEEEKYYLIECNKMDSKYHNGKDILIGKDKEKLINLC